MVFADRSYYRFHLGKVLCRGAGPGRRCRPMLPRRMCACAAAGGDRSFVPSDVWLRFQAGALSQAPTELITLKDINPVLMQVFLDILRQ
jgi:hypothetical protein